MRLLYFIKYSKISIDTDIGDGIETAISSDINTVIDTAGKTGTAQQHESQMQPGKEESWIYCNYVIFMKVHRMPIFPKPPKNLWCLLPPSQQQ